MGARITFMAIRKNDLPKTPIAVQNFVSDFFKEQKIWGEDCYVVIECDNCKSPYAYMNDDDYTEGLTEEELTDHGIFTWIDNHPELIFEYSWS
jgi:hypothetical protein